MTIPAQRTEVRIVVRAAEGSWDDMVDVQLDSVSASVAYRTKRISLAELSGAYRPRVTVALPLPGIP